MADHRTGTVVVFDVDSGLGEVRGSDGESFDFHCTAIADGSRTIEVDTEVRFDVVAGRPGVWEATAVARVR